MLFHHICYYCCIILAFVTPLLVLFTIFLHLELKSSSFTHIFHICHSIGAIFIFLFTRLFFLVMVTRLLFLGQNSGHFQVQKWAVFSWLCMGIWPEMMVSFSLFFFLYFFLFYLRCCVIFGVVKKRRRTSSRTFGPPSCPSSLFYSTYVFFNSSISTQS